jgi:hypothetical protein
MKLFKKPINATVVIPPIEDFYFTPHRFSSIGATILAALLQNQGLKVSILNFPLMNEKGVKITLPKELSYLKNQIIENETGKTTYFTSYKRFGPPDLLSAQKIIDTKPDICFFSCFAFCYAKTMLQLIKQVKKLSPDTIIIAGGAGVSAYPEFFIRGNLIDYVIAGEAETSIVALIEMLNSAEFHPENVPNLVWKNEDEIAYSLIKKHTLPEEIECPIIKTRETPKTIFLTVSLSRGCPLKCRFCSNWLSHGYEFRHNTIEHLELSIDELKQTDINEEKEVCVNFEDDNLMLDYNYWLQSIDLFKKRFPKARFYAENGIDYRLLDPAKCNHLIDLGLAQFNFSIGSVNDLVLENNNRESDLSRYDKIVASINVPVITYFICGFEQDTIESIAQNLRFFISRPTLIGISLFYPVPGISGYQDRSIFNSVSPAQCTGSAAYPWNKSLSTKTLITAFRLARYINLSKSKIKSQIEEELVQRIFTTKKLHTIIKTKNGLIIIEVPVQDKTLVEMCLR